MNKRGRGERDHIVISKRVMGEVDPKSSESKTVFLFNSDSVSITKLSNKEGK